MIAGMLTRFTITTKCERISFHLVRSNSVELGKPTIKAAWKTLRNSFEAHSAANDSLALLVSSPRDPTGSLEELFRHWPVSLV